MHPALLTLVVDNSTGLFEVDPITGIVGSSSVPDDAPYLPGMWTAGCVAVAVAVLKSGTPHTAGLQVGLTSGDARLFRVMASSLSA